MDDRIRTLLVGTVCLLAGAGGGFAAGYFLSKNKYLAMAEKEISSVKKVYEKHFNNKPAKEENSTPSTDDQKKPVIGKLVRPSSESKPKTLTPYDKLYSSDDPNQQVESVVETPKPRKVKSITDDICVITPDEFQESEYQAETLYYFADKILSDSDYNVINNVVDLIGPEALSTFGRYLNDTVYVRDKNKKIDYEIIWDARNYSSVIKNRGSKVPLPDEE